MLRRLISLTFLSASLFFAGLPAFACADCAPTQDCCPNGPPANLEAAAAPTEGVQPCCAVSPAAAAFAADQSSNKFHQHLKRSDRPAILISPAISPAAYVASSRSAAISARSSFRPSHALLYLSTGRLRL
jgi:hypothetical protein